jgi:hypothetical protein
MTADLGCTEPFRPSGVDIFFDNILVQVTSWGAAEWITVASIALVGVFIFKKLRGRR